MSKIERMTVVGAGTMGHGIAQVAAAAGIDVSLHDVDAERIRAGLDSVRANLERGIEKGKVTAEERDATLGRLHAAPDLAAAVSRSDLVVEAVPESLELKRSLFSQLDRAAPEHALLAGVPDTITGSNLPAWYDLHTADAQAVLLDSASGLPVVIDRPLGAGYAVILGFDYYT